MGHFLQITIARKTSQFLMKNFSISRDRELQEWATFCKSRSQEILHNFSRKTIQFLVIANCRNGPVSANHDRKKTLQFLKRNFSISRDRELQEWATFCKSRSQEILYNFSRKTIQFLVIANCRNGSHSANHDRKKNCTISRDCELQKWATFCKLRSQEKLYNFS